mmetsp:Transcript_32137/g.52135  ORF Transcript_32137/g.52135 Transcript_32137/m.52135 type:complete len:82 (-) Transcript_32137:78-323(-)
MSGESDKNGSMLMMKEVNAKWVFTINTKCIRWKAKKIREHEEDEEEGELESWERKLDKEKCERNAVATNCETYIIGIETTR